jgi:predicted GNAT superfamily acetyltransferase
MKIDYQKIEGKPNSQILEKINAFYQSIFEITDIEKFNNRINSAEKLFIVLAYSNDKIVGFKIGYLIDSKTFYSWVGGVKSAFRKLGIAAELMKQQHDWCKKHGFLKVVTKTKNTFKPMLILNIKNGFDVVEIYLDKKNERKIVLEKIL